MKIQLKEITIREVTENYIDNSQEGVTGYNGNLDIRPKYQREFIYKDKQRDAVIETVKKGFPLNTMYWIKNADDKYEVLDGQQRTISICQYVNGNYSLEYQYFHNLSEKEQDTILNYKLMVYICEGRNGEKLDWFKTINMVGEKLTTQELRNAVYIGPWLTDAKKYFSKTGCAAYDIGKKYLRGSAIRQDYLETAIKWISNDKVEQYMADNQNKANASKLWRYFTDVINWVTVLFPNYRKEMKGINWGELYNRYNELDYDPTDMETQITKLMQDEDVTKKAGIYLYLITALERHLSIRAFSARQKREAYEKQNGICTHCGGNFELDAMEADHINPWHSGGRTTSDNCQMLCKEDNRTKSGK